MIGQEGGTTDIDDRFARDSMENLGAWIMGRNMFGPIRGQWPDHSWKGWWGNNPPYHVPVFVLTHHARPPIEMEGGTVFHFVTDGIEAALERAREVAGGKDVRIGGGASVVRQYLQARPARRTSSGGFSGPDGGGGEPVRGARSACAWLCLCRERPRCERDPRQGLATVTLICRHARCVFARLRLRGRTAFSPQSAVDSKILTVVILNGLQAAGRGGCDDGVKVCS